MRASVKTDTTTRVISVEIEPGSVPDIDVTRSYHRKPRVFRPERATIRITDGEVREVKSSGGLVLKSGAASTEVREDWAWHPDGGWGTGSPFSKAPEWVTRLIEEAPRHVTSWRDPAPEEVQAL